MGSPPVFFVRKSFIYNSVENILWGAMLPRVNTVAVDLFCGAGGLTFGLERAGIHVALGVDVDPLCSYPYEANTRAKFVCADIRKFSADQIEKAWSDAKTRVLVGCAPCQAFSTYTQGVRQRHSKRWVLLKRFADLIEETKPEIVSMENVAPLEGTDIFRKFVKRLERLKYNVEYQTVDCREYGAAQMRRRLVLLASRLGSISLVQPTHRAEDSWRTVRDAISHLPRLGAGEISSSDPLHRSASLSDLNMRRMKASRPGGTWRDWPKDLVAACHSKKSGRTYPGVYGRMEWDKPSPTITGQCYGFGNGRFGHPVQDRALSLREAAILQTFPEDYSFMRNQDSFPGMTNLGQMIGNAVPPLLGRVIGQSIVKHLRELH